MSLLNTRGLTSDVFNIILNCHGVNGKLIFYACFKKIRRHSRRHCNPGEFWDLGQVISVLGPLKDIKVLNNGREIMVIKYAEDSKQRGCLSTSQDRIRM